ncbi:MAG: PPOX class F420-dependent oxidoreductase [Nitrososphaeraceae archaeon]
MTAMSKDELISFLSQGTFTAKLATVKENGSPHVVPLWFVLDDEGNIIFGTETSSVKGKNIQRDPRVSICVDHHEYPYSFVTIFGEVECFKRYRNDPNKEDTKRIDESNDFLYWMRKISARYVGSEKADRYANRNTTEGAVLYRLKSQHVVSEKVIADW